MLEKKPTIELAAEQIAPYVRQPEPGDTPYPINLMDESGRQLAIGEDHISGGYLILIFVTDFEDSAVKKELVSYREKAAALDDLRCKVVIVAARCDADRSRRLKNELALPFPILGDTNGGSCAAYGLLTAGANRSTVTLRSVILTPYRQVRCVWDVKETPDHGAKAVEMISNAMAAEEMRWAAPHAPVLLVPQALSADECKLLISHFERSGRLIASRPKAGELIADYKLPIYEYGRQDRVDHIINDPQLLAMIDARLTERVTPMIKQAFAFDVTQREPLHIARYVGARAGNKIGHRDNRGPTAYRRFALSLNLNDDYQGGEIVFREYSNRGYRSPPGTAIVFSSSLLHEVEETTEGVRYTLISHFFNELSVQEAQRK